MAPRLLYERLFLFFRCSGRKSRPLKRSRTDALRIMLFIVHDRAVLCGREKEHGQDCPRNPDHGVRRQYLPDNVDCVYLLTKIIIMTLGKCKLETARSFGCVIYEKSGITLETNLLYTG